MKEMQQQETKTDWFRKDRFGMFVHWGLYSIHGKGEWQMSIERISAEKYSHYADEFDPVRFDARKLVRLAKQAGMHYIVLTAKHHDGFCMFDTKYTEFNSMHACGRDLVREFVEAAQAEKMRVGLYYSLLDWHHPDYPKYHDLYHPMRGNENYRNETIDFNRYLQYMHGQIEELVSNYGKLDLLWFDFSYDHMRGETWKATELVRMVRHYQPEVLIDNRLETSGEGFGSILEETPSEYCGDFASPEQIVPPQGIRNVKGAAVPWELCTTINNNWGYVPTDTLFKPAPLLIHKLVECVSKGGNMMLNVGPNALGEVDSSSCSVLSAIGEWMALNGASIYHCGNAEIPKPEWGYYTRDGSKLYAHVLEAPIGPLALTGLRKDRILKIRRLADGSEMKLVESWNTTAYSDIPFVSFGPVPHCSYPLPDPVDTVLEIILR